MNISTGGPHILLFERDQQLTALVTSEFQLAGYECHAARTAVEVFDALARYPIRIVLVDLAQAAAARREFWVALDTQRRGRGVHVLTFHCFNLAGYGPQDPEDRSQNAMADLEIDGMLGLMKLVDEVRARVPGAGSVTNTLPRIPRATPQQTPASTPQSTRSSAPPIASGTTYRPAAESPAGGNVAPRNSTTLYPQQAASIAAAPTAPTAPPTPAATPINSASGISPAQTTNNAPATKPASYTDKIRAVLYPNQRTWSPQAAPPTPAPQENRLAYNVPDSSTNTGGADDFTVLQRLANGQTGTESPGESGLAQLSRLAQASYPPATNNTYEADLSYQQRAEQQRAEQQQASQQRAEQQRAEQQQAEVPPMAAPPIRARVSTEQTSGSSSGAVNYGAPQTAAHPVQTNEKISTQPLRASPIQDLPMDRVGSTQTASEGGRRPDVLSRTNYGQPTLASISTPSPAQTPIPASPDEPVAAFSQEEFDASEIETLVEEEYREEDTFDTTTEDAYAIESTVTDTLDQEELSPAPEQERPLPEKERVSPVHNNAALFDIMQSLPPMPPVTQQPQQIQPQVLTGRATRSLGSVLLSGHLVPQNRLEVAQNIQRMLRGVDLNYQLGEILLMFKLLTPDQLLAASLVSYGLITTTQISSLGRIRQELHSIGLEYDLESLIILFRILTPEQLREAKTGIQG
ncbi:MAG: hypothetical protein M3Y39_12105 [Chloroflexota bacterium]|nr:hypothetical protein [Chloroflexota bacterium]